MAAVPRGAGDRVIIVGVDFGTTYTGVAYAESQRPDRVHVIRAWPNHTGTEEQSGKVQSKLRYMRDGTFQWGAMIPPDAPHDEVLEYFKLALDPEHTEKLQDGSKLIKGNLLGQDLDKIVTDYMTGLCAFVKEHLARQLTHAVVDTTPFEYVVTVPAIWSDRAKQRTVDAFARAMGADRSAIHPVTEPEAAATCVLHQTAHQAQAPPHGGRALSAGDCFVVVDAGGGTVDLISYTIKDPPPRLSVSEAAPGSGAACGAAFLNERFQRLVVETLGQEDGFDGNILRDTLEKWETMVKRRFTMADLPGETYTFPVEGLEDNRALRIRRSRWTVTAPEVFRVFDSIILQVLKLVTDQRAATQVDVSAVFLVGGFGQSVYLQERLQTHLGERIQVIQPTNPWTAVVEGAVLKGLARVAPERDQVIKVVDRKARKHYGFELSVAYHHNLHGQIQDKKRWDTYTGQWEVDVMQWFIKKGDPVTESRPYSKEFALFCKVNFGRPNTVLLYIYSDDTSDVAPLAMNDHVKTLCMAEADLSHIPDDQLTQRQGTDGVMYYVVDCQIEIVYDSASAAYTLVHNGQRYNTVTAELL